MGRWTSGESEPCSEWMIGKVGRGNPVEEAWSCVPGADRGMESGSGDRSMRSCWEG
jgi:hypothetical protein